MVSSFANISLGVENIKDFNKWQQQMRHKPIFSDEIELEEDSAGQGYIL